MDIPFNTKTILEYGEMVEQAAIREAKEETGLESKADSIGRCMLRSDKTS